LRDLCDVIYVMHVEQLTAAVNTERVVAATLGVEMPTLDVERLRFDTELAAPPRPETSVHAKLRHLGVA